MLAMARCERGLDFGRGRGSKKFQRIVKVVYCFPGVAPLRFGPSLRGKGSEKGMFDVVDQKLIVRGLRVFIVCLLAERFVRDDYVSWEGAVLSEGNQKGASAL